MNTIEIDQVSKWFGHVVAVNDVTMTIGGGITGLLGPNGAGKTTLMNMMAGFAAPSSGRVTLGQEPTWRNEKVYSKIGMVPEGEAMYDFLTGHEFVLANAKLHGLRQPKQAATRAIETVEMEYAAQRTISTYSKGMRQRLKMAAALVHDPQVLLLDEPFNGMDPRQRMQLMKLLQRMGSEGRTVLFSSHILEEVEQLATHIEVMVAGRHAASGDYRAIRRLMTDRPHRYLLNSDDDRSLAAALVADGAVQSVNLDEDENLEVQTSDFGQFIRRLPRLAKDNKIRLYDVSPTDESLESVFGYLVQS
ncbi:MAG TPA: ABC transporter ATP-binding protein [Candidatus Stackebrandtia faecavium]|nr:ABC transporter ATP-binding protein [Candidatus Stackebrandtia faecavium]